VVTSATVNSVKGGVYANITATASKTYSGSVYVKGTGTVEVYLRDNTGATESSRTSVTLSATTWKRVTVNDFSVGGGSPDLWLAVVEATADSNITFYCDGWQVEQNGISNLRGKISLLGDGLLSPGMLPLGMSEFFSRWVTLPTPTVCGSGLTIPLRPRMFLLHSTDR
jgi:hypothetical protein